MFTRSAEIELRAQNVTDPKVIGERTLAVRKAKGEEFFARCVGKRITTRAVECVQKAATPAEVDQCLD